ncbi:unnamed protein product [Lactuca virosa]|uniref:C2 domain-containing protein n=1 Tax=Lactuca virosa TaxID=75947 RepID=A0AAU9LG43_9ASTR|nr:unnamed protein product [Lactuca virosa]
MEAQIDEPETMILEINLISAQGLKIPPSAMMRRMHTYALAWVNSNAKLCSDLDCVGGENPTWNEKFIFRVSQDFVKGDTSAVQFHIYAVGYIRDYFIGTVRYLLSSSPNYTPKSGPTIDVPAFSALHIRRPSGRVCGILNIAATVHNSSDFASLTGISAICFRDLMGKHNKIFNQSRQVSRRLNHVGVKSNEQSSEPESCNSSCEESVCFSDDTESIASNSSSSTTVTAFSDSNGVRSNLIVAGKKERKSDGASLLCGLTLQRRSGLSDQNIETDGQDLD